MQDERWQRLKSAFGAAIEAPEGLRADVATGAVGNDPELKSTVDRLLRQSQAAAVFEDLHRCLVHTIDEAYLTGEDDTLLAPGTVIDGYTIEQLIGVGGMSEVYRARQASPARAVAIKVIKGPHITRRAAMRLEAEARILARLDHPSIARVIAAGTLPMVEGRPAAAGMPYLVMELVEGRPLTDHAREAGLSIRQKVELFIPVCEAVEHAHRRLVIHRDLKPANIMVDGTGRARVLDFGISRAVDEDTRLTRADTGIVPGTLDYMSPEHASGDPSAVETRSDVYCLGVVLYELLTGRLPTPTKGRPLFEVQRAIREETPPSARRINPDVPQELSDVLSAALEKEPDRRCQTAGVLAEDLGRFLRFEPLSIRRPSAWYRARKFAQRRKGVTAALLVSVLVVLVSVLAGGAATAWQFREAVLARRQSDEYLQQARLLARDLLFEVPKKIENVPGAAAIRRDLMKRALDSYEALAGGSNDPELLSDLAKGYINLGVVSGVPGADNAGDYDTAIKMVDAGLSLWERVVALDPSDKHMSGLSEAYVNKANLLPSASDRGPLLDRSVVVLRGVLDRRGWDLATEIGGGLGQRLAYLLTQAGHNDYTLGRPLDRKKEAIQIMDRVILARPQEPQYLQTKGILLETYAECVFDIAPADAAVIAADAVAMFQEHIRRIPGDRASIRHTHLSQLIIARAAAKGGQIEEALRLVETAAAGLMQPLASDPTHSRWQHDWMIGMETRAHVRQFCAAQPSVVQDVKVSLLNESLGIYQQTLDALDRWNSDKLTSPVYQHHRNRITTAAAEIVRQLNLAKQ